MVIRDDFPNMKRVDLVQICIDILEKIVFLHNNGIVLCDINLGNILVDGITQGKPMTYFIDTDSYQLGDLLGEVGVDIFTPPELHGKDLGKIKRTFENEYFSVSTLLFMIVMPGKALCAYWRNWQRSRKHSYRDFPLCKGRRVQW